MTERAASHQWWCGGKEPCACTDGWKQQEAEKTGTMTERAQALEAAMRKIRAHTSYNPAAGRAFLAELLASVERIADAALLAVQPPPPVGSPTTEDVDEAASALWRALCEGDGEHSEALDRAIITAHMRRLLQSTPVEPAGATQHDLDMELARERRDNDRMRELLKMQHPGPTLPDVTCEHGTAMDVHCCNCHSGFIFDTTHECPPPPVRHVATCETNGHVYGHTGACVFCTAPKPVDSIPEE